jgi:serine/threonine protein kinase
MAEALGNGQDQLVGQTLAKRFRLLRVVGDGGMATVYAGETVLPEGAPGLPIAVKVIHPDLAKDRVIVRRFKREAQAAFRLEHPNLVKIHHQGVDGEHPFLVMELLHGKNLHQVLYETKRLSQQRAAELVMQVCAGLDVAHRQGIVHRDLKPGNIMLLEPLDGPLRVKVLDFGIAKMLDVETPTPPPQQHDIRTVTQSVLTRVGTIVGTPAYMSPEQCLARPIDGRSDVYTCGVLLFEMVTGQLPFEGESPLHVAMKHAHEPPPSPSSVWPRTHSRLEEIILRTLRKAPEERFQSALELAEALAAVLPTLGRESVAPAAFPSQVMVTEASDSEPPTQAIEPHTRPGPAGARPFQGGTDTSDDDEDDVRTIAVEVAAPDESVEPVGPPRTMMGLGRVGAALPPRTPMPTAPSAGQAGAAKPKAAKPGLGQTLPVAHAPQPAAPVRAATARGVGHVAAPGVAPRAEPDRGDDPEPVTTRPADVTQAVLAPAPGRRPMIPTLASPIGANLGATDAQRSTRDPPAVRVEAPPADPEASGRSPALTYPLGVPTADRAPDPATPPPTPVMRPDEPVRDAHARRPGSQTLPLAEWVAGGGPPQRQPAPSLPPSSLDRNTAASIPPEKLQTRALLVGILVGMLAVGLVGLLVLTFVK